MLSVGWVKMIGMPAAASSSYLMVSGVAEVKGILSWRGIQVSPAMDCWAGR